MKNIITITSHKLDYHIIELILHAILYQKYFIQSICVNTQFDLRNICLKTGYNFNIILFRMEKLKTITNFNLFNTSNNKPILYRRAKK